MNKAQTFKQQKSLTDIQILRPNLLLNLKKDWYT